jgi:hypothetical protein
MKTEKTLPVLFLLQNVFCRTDSVVDPNPKESERFGQIRYESEKSSDPNTAIKLKKKTPKNRSLTT